MRINNYIAAIIIAILIFSSLPAIAQSFDPIKIASNKMSPDLIPPEVTLSNTPAAGTSGEPAASSSNTPAANNPSNIPAANGSNPNLNQLLNAHEAAPTENNLNPSQATNPNSSQPNPNPTQGQPDSSADNRSDPLAIIETDKGNIVIRLFRKYAPKSTANFIELVNKGFYNGLTFHRVEPGFCIQGGCPRGDGYGVYIEPGGQNKPRLLPLETSTYLKHNAAGVVAMAHFPKNPNSSSCQFYITLAAQPQLDGDYSIFGGVVQGMDVVNKIAKGDKMKRITVQEQN